MIVIDLGSFIQAIQASTEPTDLGYEERCIRFDAERAAKMGEPIERACSWGEGSLQRWWWASTYQAAGGKV